MKKMCRNTIIQLV